MKQEGNKLAFILPSVIVTFVFYLFPLVYCLLYAFSGTSGHFTYAGISNYLSLFQNETFQLALKNTYFLMLLCVMTIVFFSLMIVYYLDTSKVVLGVLLIFSLPMLIPPTMITQCMKEGAVEPRLVLLLIFLWKYTGFHVLLLKTMEATMSTEWIEAAVLDRANKWHVFSRITCWYLWPYIRFLIIFDVICFFRLFRESYLLYGLYPPDQVYMISNFFFNNFQNLRFHRLSTAAIVALTPILIINCILLRAGRKHEMV